MSCLKEAILKAQRAAKSNVAPLATSVVADGPIVTVGRNVELSRSQLATLRRKFETTIVGRTRFEDGENYVQWGGQANLNSTNVNDARAPQVISLKPHIGAQPVVPRRKVHKKKEAWQEKLRADLQAVCNEAGLTPKASAAIVRAAEKGSITGNPGVLLCLLVRFQGALEGPLGKRQAMLLLQSAPVLLNISTESLTWHFEEMVEIFGHKAAADMVSKQPVLMTCNPFSIWTNLEALRSMLDTSMDKVQHMVSRQPRLLLVSPSILAQRITDFMDLISPGDVGVPALRRVFISQPALLTYNAATLAQNIDEIMSMLDLDREQVCKLISKTPSLVMLSPATLVGKVEDLAGLLGCSCEEAVKIMVRQPSVLCVSSQLLHTKLENLICLLNITHVEAADIIKSQPNLLTLSSDSLASKMQALSAAVHGLQAQQHGLSASSTDASSSDTYQQCVQSRWGQHHHYEALNAETHHALSTPVSNHERQAATPGVGAAAELPCMSTTSTFMIAPQIHKHQSQANVCTESTAAAAGGYDGVFHSHSAQGVQQEHMARSNHDVSAILIHAWQKQLSSAPPRALAAYTCFSEQRYARLQKLVDAVSARIFSPDEQGQEKFMAGLEKLASKKWALSRVLRVGDSVFYSWLADMHCMLTA